MKHASLKGILFLLAFFMLVPGAAFLYNPHFPQLILIGEDSVGTWLSGALLLLSAAFCLVTALQQKTVPWLWLSIFFIVLALDERFMFHEQLKERIIFATSPALHQRWIYETPVIIAAGGGLFMASLLWKELNAMGRWLLIAATVLGTTSVIIDIMTASVIWEESCKLLAELLLCFALLKKTIR